MSEISTGSVPSAHKPIAGTDTTIRGTVNPLDDQSRWATAMLRLQKMDELFKQLGVIDDGITMTLPTPPCPLEGVACTRGVCTIHTACLAPTTR